MQAVAVPIGRDEAGLDAAHGNFGPPVQTDAAPRI